MSLPPALRAKMSLLVLAHLSFSLVRSGESWSPQAARQKESRCEEQAGREETNRTTEEKGDQVRWHVGRGEGSHQASAPAGSHPNTRCPGCCEGRRKGPARPPSGKGNSTWKIRTVSQASPHPRGQPGADDIGGSQQVCEMDGWWAGWAGWGGCKCIGKR